MNEQAMHDVHYGLVDEVSGLASRALANGTSSGLSREEASAAIIAGLAQSLYEFVLQNRDPSVPESTIPGMAGELVEMVRHQLQDEKELSQLYEQGN